jgi:hypothetical protein
MRVRTYMKYFYMIAFWTMLSYSSYAIANEIYIEQIGDTLVLDITQDGKDNEIGDSTTDAGLFGDTMTFSITQTGDTNTIDAIIAGDSYTGTWVFTGNSNNVDLLCNSVATTGGGNCDTVTLNITTTGDYNNFDFKIGETNDSSDATINFTVDGDYNLVNMDLDGIDANVTVAIDNSAVSTTGTVTSANDTSMTTSGPGNIVDLSISGDGDSLGHTVTLDITGGLSVYTITQSGIFDNLVDITSTGNGNTVDISQSD